MFSSGAVIIYESIRNVNENFRRGQEDGVRSVIFDFFYGVKKNSTGGRKNRKSQT